MDLLLDPTSWDIVWNNGPLTKEFTTQPLTQTVAQRLKIRLLSFRGDWFINTAYGIPYFQSILGHKQKSKASVDLIFQTEILLEPGVREIVTFNSTLTSNREYNLVFSIKVVDGTVSAPITLTI